MNIEVKDSGKELKSFLESSLPMLFPRSRISELTNGIISYRTMVNLDYKRLGPPIVRVGRKICYSKKDFIAWAVKFYCIDNVENY